MMHDIDAEAKMNKISEISLPLCRLFLRTIKNFRMLFLYSFAFSLFVTHRCNNIINLYYIIVIISIFFFSVSLVYDTSTLIYH